MVWVVGSDGCVDLGGVVLWVRGVVAMVWVWGEQVWVCGCVDVWVVSWVDVVAML